MPHLNDNDNLILDADIIFQEKIVLKSKNKQSPSPDDFSNESLKCSGPISALFF